TAERAGTTAERAGTTAESAGRLRKNSQPKPRSRLARSRHPGPGLQRADAVGERRLAVAARSGCSIAARPVAGGRAGALGENRLDWIARPFDQAGEARHLGGELGDALAHHRVLLALVRKGGLGFAPQGLELTRELGAFLFPSLELTFEQRLFGAL